MKILCTLLAVASCLITNAQIKTYAETRREQDNRAYNEAYLDNIRNQRNSTIWFNGGVDKKAVQELVNQWKKKAPVYSTQLSAEAEAEAKAAAAERRKEARAQEIAKYERAQYEDYMAEQGRKARREENYNELLKAGFVNYDAKTLADYYTTYSDGTSQVNEYSKAAIERSYIAVKQFYQSKEELSFDSLNKIMFRSYQTLGTFFKMADALQQRFPEKAKEIEFAKLKATCFKDEEWEKGNHYFATSARSLPYNNNEDRLKFLSFFAEHYSDYPEVVAYLLGQCRQWFNPVTELAGRALAAKDKDAARPLYEYSLFIRYPLTGDKPHPLLSEVISTLKSKYLDYMRSKTTAFYRSFAAAQGILPLQAVEILAGYSTTGNFSTVYFNNHSEKRGEMDFYVLRDNTIGAALILKALADEGDPSCANGYAVYLLGEKRSSVEEKVQGIRYREKAIGLGSNWARLNLAFEAAVNTPGAPTFESMKMSLKNYCDTASEQARLNLVSCVIKEGVHQANDPWFFAFAYEQLKKLTDAGNKNAVQYLSSDKNVFKYGVYTGKVSDIDWRGGKYSGMVRNGVPHGHGKLVKDKVSYEGNFYFGDRVHEFTVKEGLFKKRTAFYRADYEY